MRDSTLMAQPFDAASRRLSGEAVPLVEGVLQIPGAEVAVFTASAEGTLAYQTGSAVTHRRLVWHDREGRDLGTLGEPTDQASPRLSPDGRSVAVEVLDPESNNLDIWTYDVGRGVRSRFTFDPAVDDYPIWSPDGRKLVFSSRRGDQKRNALWVAPVGGAEPPRRLADDASRSLYTGSWSPDGERILVTALADKTVDLVVVPAAGGDPQPFIVTGFNEGNGAISPDGRWAAYQSDESGRYEVYVTSFPKPGRKWQVSSHGGTAPAWRGDGRELFFRDDAHLYAAEVDGRGERFDVGQVKQLFALPKPWAHDRQYDVTRDGQRFLVDEPLGASQVSPVTLVLHWDAELPH